MKKLFAIVAVIGAFTFGSIQLAQAQDAPAAEQTEQQAAPAAAQAAPAAAPAAEEGGIHKEIKVKFIEGTASFMSLVAIALVIGLAFCIERIIYLSLAEINTKKFMASIEAALEKGDVEAAKDIARNTRGPVASIYYQGLMRIDQGIDVVEKSVVSYGGVQAGYLENFKANDITKLPSPKKLEAEYAQLASEKAKFYEQYKEAKEELLKLKTAKQNVASFFREEEQTQQER